ncbi:MAG: Mor transcription activator family protein [Xanthomonadaceae bacterium]|nr:Mor transcription activator family protein [Xanthomonadaceae bacterium]MDP2185042.1 Mor transcription activator family protein [Xanthomonadales bacterium]MDZ4114421.1 Mor transcription activator family protein [Xanthomonadaceae bacterium]
MSTQPDLIGLPEDADERQALADRVASDGAMDETDTKWAPFLTELLQVLEARYARRGMCARDAFDLARDSVLEIAQHLGGRVRYIPRGDRIRTSLRDAEIYRRCNGRNHDALATEFGITAIHVYRVCRQQYKLHLGRMQGRLAFNEDQ